MSDMAIVPIEPRPNRDVASALIEQGRERSRLVHLVRYSAADLRRIMSEAYTAAFNANVILALQLLLQNASDLSPAGTVDATGCLFTWAPVCNDLRIVAAFNATFGTLNITVNDHAACDDRDPHNIVFVPGRWLDFMLDTFEAMDDDRASRARRESLRERRELAELLGAQI